MLLESHSVNISIKSCTTHFLCYEEAQSQSEKKTHSVNGPEQKKSNPQMPPLFIMIFFYNFLTCLSPLQMMFINNLIFADCDVFTPAIRSSLIIMIV